MFDFDGKTCDLDQVSGLAGVLAFSDVAPADEAGPEPHG
jgi:hypothetical protein